MATSRPILFRNLKQPATAFAGLKTRRVTPGKSIFLHAEMEGCPDVRTVRIDGEEILGA